MPSIAPVSIWLETIIPQWWFIMTIVVGLWRGRSLIRECHPYRTFHSPVPADCQPLRSFSHIFSSFFKIYIILFLSPSKFHRQLKAFQGWTHGRPIIFRRLRLKILTDFFSKYFLIATQYILYSKLKAYITGLTQNRFYFQANKHDVIKVYQQSNYLSLSLSFKHLKGQSEPCCLGWHYGKRCGNPEKLQRNHAGFLWVWICPNLL